MKKQQLSFSDFEHKAKRKQTRRERFLAEMDRLVPWKVLADLVEPHYGGTSGMAAGSYASDSLHAALVRSERPGHGGCAV